MSPFNELAFFCVLSWILITFSVQVELGCTTCGHCKDDAPCSNTTCTCPDGCKKFWIGERCNREIPPIPKSYVNCSWLQTASSRSLEIRWCQIQSLHREFADFYGYLIEYKKRGALTSSKGPIVGHQGDQKIQTAILAGLEPRTVYVITVWPYRTSEREYDYGRKYDSIVGETLSPHGETVGPQSAKDGCSWLPWILFGVAGVVVVFLIGVIVMLYLKFVRRNEASPRNNLGLDNAGVTGTGSNAEPSMSTSSSTEYTRYLTTNNTDGQNHQYQELTIQDSTKSRDNQKTYEIIK